MQNMSIPAACPSFAPIIEKYRPKLEPYEELYRHCHANPELSLQEKETAATITSHLKDIGHEIDLEIKTGIGGHGQIAIFRNGEGKTILLRADIDAMPVQEKTGLPYASTKTTTDSDGMLKPVMHACGHDVHLVSLLAAAETLIAARSTWTGTIIFLFQPAEERGVGSRAMVDDGLYSKHGCPLPDVVLGQHVMPLPAGKTGIRHGAILTAADSFEITIYGSGGHGSMPHRCIDPVAVASHVVVRLQTIVSREVPPDVTAVITVGSVQAGMTENVIPDEAVLKLNVRTFDNTWRERILASIRRIVNAECVAGNCPKEAKFENTSTYPLTDNDEDVTATIDESFKTYFGERHDSNIAGMTASEDFGTLGSAIDRPYCFWVFGGLDQKLFEEGAGEGNALPANHSPFFAPAVQPTLETGVDALVVAALSCLG